MKAITYFATLNALSHLGKCIIGYKHHKKHDKQIFIEVLKGVHSTICEEVWPET